MFTKLFRKKIIITLGVTICFFMVIFASNVSAKSKTFPTKDIICTVGFSPGGGYDLYSRTVLKLMKKYLPGKRNMIIHNRTGAGGLLAAIETYRSKPDGHRFAIWGIQGLYMMQLAGETKYDLKKVTWLGKISTDTMVLTVSPRSGFKSLKDLQKAKKVKLGITGFASAASMMGALAMEKFAINVNFVSGHKRSAEAIVATMRGDVDGVQWSAQTLIPYINKGDLVPIVQYGPKRDKELPNVPTAGELGYPELDKIIKVVRGFGGPPAIPKERVKILRKTMWKALKDPDLAAWSKKTGTRIDIDTGENLEKEVIEGMKLYDNYKNVVLKYLK